MIIKDIENLLIKDTLKDMIELYETEEMARHQIKVRANFFLRGELNMIHKMIAAADGEDEIELLVRTLRKIEGVKYGFVEEIDKQKR